MLVNNDVVKFFFDIVKGDMFFVINICIGYGGDICFDIFFKLLNYENVGEKVVFSGGEFQFNVDKDGNVVLLLGEVQSGLVDVVNEYNQKV